MKYLVWLSLVYLLVADGLILGKAWYNRQLPSGPTFQLSDRELARPYRHRSQEENSGVSLELRWHTLPDDDGDYADSYGSYWLTLTLEQFDSIGFPPCNSRQQLEQLRPGWVVLEMNGPGYQKYIQVYAAALRTKKAELAGIATLDKAQREDLERAEANLMRAQSESSRLMIVAAAGSIGLLLPKMTHLQQANPGVSYGLVRANLRAAYRECDRGLEMPYRIEIESLAVSSIHLPREFARLLPAGPDTEAVSHYQLELVYGRLVEPWIKSFSLDSSGH